MSRATYIALSVIALLPFFVDASGTATTSQASYWMTLVQIGTKIALSASALLSLAALSLTLIYGYEKVSSKETMRQNQERRPMTFMKVIGGLLVATVLYLPLHTMTLMGDIMGTVRSDKGTTLCMVTEVQVRHFKWVNNASSCIEHIKSKAQEFAQYTERDHLDSANLPLLFGLFQLLGLIFFISASWMLAKNFLGYRDLKVTPSMAIVAMFASSFIMTIPNVVDYVKDIRGQNNQIISPPHIG